MTIEELKTIITGLKIALTDLIEDGVLTAEEAKIISPVLIENMIKHNPVKI